MMQKAEYSAAGETAVQPMLPHSYRIRRVNQDTYDTFTLELEPVKRNGGFYFAPGQFNMLYIFGVGEVPISICGDPAEDGRLVHTTRAVGAVTKAMQRLKVDDTVGVRGPYGTSWPMEQSNGKDIIIIAGGIGLAPLRPSIYYVLKRREQYGKVVLLYGTRSPDDLLYQKELERWRSRFDLDVQITVDRAVREWHGNVGVVTSLIPRAGFDPHNAVAMVCGPEIMMRYTAAELVKRGMAGDSIYVSMERNMKCGIGLCGHCQCATTFVCKDGPVYTYSAIKDLFTKREI
jgi:NAD(P)H-flavin reductase